MDKINIDLLNKMINDGLVNDTKHKTLPITIYNYSKFCQFKKEWNEKIEKAGEIHGIANPKYATREGCWQGESGMSNVVLSKNIIAANSSSVNLIPQDIA